MDKWPIGVFASIDAGLGVKLEVAHELGIPTIHLHAPHQRTRTPAQAEQFLAKLKEFGIAISVVFGGFEGESYADIPTTAKTVGLVPPEWRAARTAEMKEIADFANMLGCEVVALHLGFIPHDTSDPLYAEILQVTREVCDHCQANGQNLHLETGQETADALLQFIGDVDRDGHVEFVAGVFTFGMWGVDELEGTLREEDALTSFTWDDADITVTVGTVAGPGGTGS